MDQEERNIRAHLDARQRTVDFIRSHQREFECFLDEDEQSFEEYCTWMAGDWCVPAFCTLHR